MIRTLLAVGLLLVMASTAVAAEAPELAAARELFDKGDYRGCLAKISAYQPARTTPLPPTGKNPPIDPGPRYGLFMLRGECHLRLNDRTEAMEAFKSAQIWAATTPERAAATGVTLLLQDSPKLVYTPPGMEAIDVVAPESRLQALKLLFDRRLAMVEQEIQKAASAKSLSKARQTLPKLAELYLLEVGSGESGTRTSQAAEPLADACRALVLEELRPIEKRTAELKKKASQRLRIRDSVGKDHDTHRGLATDEKAELRKMIEQMKELKALMQMGHQLNPNPKDSDGWSEARNSIDAVLNETNAVLKRNWTKWEN